ncbi:MAG: hypothetical protein ICV66_08630 [Chitinophagaceae bacterium]|nr:hypothetical protein [Chitinophagaceae bacterium]
MKKILVIALTGVFTSAVVAASVNSTPKKVTVKKEYNCTKANKTECTKAERSHCPFSD